ncbi:MAG: hypothetical protein VZR53_13160 [Prevotella sp.]|nr:hypothetical protein [Prevotella sp.]
MGCKRLTKWWYLQVRGLLQAAADSCKRLTKWWYLQDEVRVLYIDGGIKGSQSGDIYKVKPYATLL